MNLETLRFADTKVAELDFVSALPRLLKLELDNAREIASLAPLRGHSSLTELYVIGDTRAQDGDLDVRTNMPSLWTGSLTNRPF